MSWGIFNIGNWIQSLKTPSWLRAMLGSIQQIIISTMVSIGKAYIQQLGNKIIEVEGMNISGEEKWAIVFKFGKSILPNVSDSMLNLAIELLVNMFKKTGFARVS